ncbi:MAG TPA: DUF4134 family protein [Anseongella sp.]
MTFVPALKIALTGFLYVITLLTIAQPGIDEFAEVETQINKWYYNLSDLVLAIGGICGLLGGARIYANWQAGKPRIDLEVSGWFFACLFLSLTGAAVRLLFGLS